MGGTVGVSIEHSLPLPQSLPASMAASALVTSSLKSHHAQPIFAGFGMQKGAPMLLQSADCWAMSEEVEQCWSTSHTAVADARSQGGLRGHRGVEAALWSPNIHFLSQFMKSCHFDRASFSCLMFSPGILTVWGIFREFYDDALDLTNIISTGQKGKGFSFYWTYCCWTPMIGRSVFLQ